MKKFNTIKKSRKKSTDVDEKIEYLNKECQKTGLNEIMTTTGMYQGSTKVPNQDYNDFNGLSQGGYGLALSGADGNSLGNGMIGVHPSSGISGVALSPPHPVTGVRKVASTVVSSIGANRSLRPGIGTRVRGTNNDGSPRIIKDGSALWFFDSNYSLGGIQGRWLNFEWLDGQLGFWDTGFLGFFFHNTNLDQFQLFGNNVGTEIKNKIAGINFGTNGDLGEPKTTVFFQNDLGDPGFLPIDVMSPQAYETILDKARRNQIAAEYPRKDPLDRMIDFLDKDIKNKPWPGKDPEDPFKFSQGHQTSSYKPEGDLLSEAIKLGHFEPEVLNVDINDIRKGIVPEFPKDPPPEMIGGYSAKSRLVRKDPEFPPFIKVTRKDLARNHKLTDKEITEYMNDIKLINDYI